MHEHHLHVGRTARYVVLGPDDPAAVRGVWFVLHGYGQLAATFIRHFAPLDDGSRLIIAAEALNRFYLADVASSPAADRPVGATWMTREDREHEITDYVAYLDALWGEMVSRLPERAPYRLTVLGFSQGTATAARWVSLGTARPAQLVLWGGLFPPELDLDRLDHPVRRTDVHLVVGSRDRFVTTARLAEEEARLRAADIDFEVTRYEGGHGIRREVLTEVAIRIGA
jgi:predicted esterase